MKTMEFTQVTIEQAISAIKKHDAEFKLIQKESADKTLEEVAQMMIIEKFGDAQIEAEEIVSDLKKGLADFDAQFRENVETGKINIVGQLTEATKNKSDEERKNCYVNILTAIQLLNNKEISQEEIEAKQAENALLSNEELLVGIEEEMNSAISLDSLAANVQNELNEEILSELAEQLEMNKEDYRFMAALWLYIEQRENNIQLSDSEFALPATELGALAGAGVEAITTTNKLNEGKIDMKTWQKVMKWILGALIGIALGILALKLVVSVSILALMLVWSLLGAGTIAFLFSIFVSIYVTWKASDFVTETWIQVLELYSNFYNKYIMVVTNKVVSWVALVKEWVTTTVAKVGTAVKKGKETQTAANSENVTVVTNDNEENTQGMQPVMA